MHKIFFLIITFGFINLAYANSLYFTASYLKAPETKALETKQHIFINKNAVIKYRNIHYHLLLKKCDETNIQIEHETYLFDGDNKSFLSAGVWSGTIKDQMVLRQYNNKKKLVFQFTVIPTKIKKD